MMLAFLRLVIVLALLVGPLSARTFRTDGARSWGEDAARGIVLLVCATQVLALFGALDLVSVLLAIGAVSVGSLLRGRPLRATLDGLSMQAHQLLYDVLDGEMRPQRVGLRLRAVGDALSEWYRRTGRTVGQLGLLTAVVVWSTWIRLGALLEQASPESAVEFAADPESIHLADAPLIEGLVAAAVSAQTGADAGTVKDAAEAVYRPPAHPHGPEHAHQQPPDAQGDFELVNQAGMHARPAAKIAGGLAGMEAEVTVNGVDGASMTELMMLGAAKGTVLHIEASGADAAKAVDYLGGLIKAGFGEP